MIADLLEPEQVGQDQPAALHAFDPMECTGQILNGPGIEGRLLFGQAAEGLHLGFVGKIGDDAFIGLEPAKDVGLNKAA